MSLDKAIEHGKEYRKAYIGAKSICPSCRNHGSCDWRKSNRLKKFIVREIAANERIISYNKGETNESI